MSTEPISLTPELLSIITQEVAARLAANAAVAAWLTPCDAAAYLQLSRRGLEDMRARGDGPPFYRVNRIVRYHRADLDAWLQTNGGARG